jgi:Ca2+-binding RTX toxin-like protein
MTTILQYYKYSTLAAASYVQAGSLTLGHANYGLDFAVLANSQSGGRLPTSLARRLFDPSAAVPGVDQWQIIDYYGGDIAGVTEPSGFAATLFQQGDEKVLAIRGTEPDADRFLGLPITGIDVLSADLGQIGIFGLALTQVVAMANYVMRLKGTAGHLVPQITVEASLTQPSVGPYLEAQGEFGSTVYIGISAPTFATGLGKLGPNETVKVTGHSLGGHVAVMAAWLFPDVFDQEVMVFNAPGYDPTTANFIGLLEQVSPIGSAQLFKSAIAWEIGVAANLLDTHANQLITSPNSGAMALEKLNQALGREAASLSTPAVVRVVSEDVAPGEDLDIVAGAFTGAYRYGSAIQVTTEANSHVIEPLMDALSMHAFLYSMNQSLTLQDTNRILEATSRGVTRTEETLLESLYKVMSGQTIRLAESDATVPTLNPLKFEKGSIAAREDYFRRLLELEDLKKDKPWTVASVVGMELSELIGNAQAADGIAYRYALRELNPFALLGPDTIYNNTNTGPGGETIPSLNAAGDLDPFLSPTDTPAGMTPRYIEDRAAFLVWKNAANIVDAVAHNDPSSSDSWRYVDSGQLYSISVVGNSSGLPTRMAAFGGDGVDALQGTSTNDRIYGGKGRDFIEGGRGDDYMEGGVGRDLYQYVGSRSIQGTILLNDGSDEILDTDGEGLIRYSFTQLGIFSNTVQTSVIGGVGIETSETTWQSPDAKFTYTQHFDGALGVTINGDAGGSIRILDFDFTQARADGFMGIRLIDPPGLPTPTRVIEGDLEPLDIDPNTPGTQTETDEFGNLLVTTDPAPGRVDTLFGSDGQNGSNPNDNIMASGGDDVIDAKSGDDIVQGGSGRDTIVAGTGNDLVEAGANGTDAGDIVDGGDGADRLYADARFNPAGTPATELAAALAAGEAQSGSGLKGDFLSAGLGNDVVIGAVGDDVLAGGAGSDILIGGAGNDFLLGDSRIRAANLDWDVTRTSTGQYPIPAPLGPIFDFALFDTDVVDWMDDADAGADALYGGAGNDWMDGGAGDDFLDAGSGNDVAFGNLGNDVLLGGAGNDVLDGDHASIAASFGGDDYLDGGEGHDWLYGRGGNDILFGGSGDDNIEGNEGNDILVGGPGSDVLRGGTGKDTYVLSRGDGFDAVFDTSDTATAADASVVVLDGAFTRGQVKFKPGSLIIDAGEGDGLWIEGFDPDDPLSTPVLSAIQFADGDFMTFEDILAQGFDIDGTPGDDLLEGTAVTDRINGFEGNDDIYGKAGDDTIDAGAGFDIVDAGDGNDTITTGEGADIVFGGAGDDTVFADDGDLIIDVEGTNHLDLTGYTGLTEANLEVTQYQGPDGEIYLNFHIRDGLNPGVTPTTGGVSLQKGELGSFATVTLEDGAGGTVTLTHAELMAEYAAHGLVYDGSAASETLIGTPYADTFFGGAGADSIQAGSGDDRIDGGAGEDVLDGGAGNDTYLLASNGQRDTVIEDGAAEPNAIHTIQLDAGIASTHVKATRVDDDLEVRLKATADALVIKDFYLQPATWQAGWQVRDPNGVTTTLTDYVPVIPPAAENWLDEQADAFRARREQVFAANRRAEGYTIGSGSAASRTVQTFDYALRTSNGSTTTRALEIESETASDTFIVASTEFSSTPLAQSSASFDIGIPLAGGAGGDRGSVGPAFGTGGASTGASTEYIPTGSGSLGMSGTSFKLGTGDYAIPVYSTKSGNSSGVRNSGGVDYANAGSFNDTSLWTLSGFRIVRGGEGNVQFGQVAATAIYFNYDQRLTVTDIVGGPESSVLTVEDASVIEAGDGDDQITLGAGFFFAGPDWERALNPNFVPTFVSPFATHQGQRKQNLGGFVDAGAGSDTITGSFGQDTIAGGTGSDEMDGREGSDRYLLAVDDTGTDSIVDRANDQHDYHNWFYWSREIFDWEERLEHGNEWRVLEDYIPHYFDTEEDADQAIAEEGYHDKTFIPALPELAPVVAWNDAAMTTQLINAGVMAEDVIEFGPGISLGNLEFAWDEEVIEVNSPDFGFENVNYAILEISWVPQSSVRIAMPRPDDPLGFGIERFQFADGSSLSLAEIVALAPEPTPDFGPATVIEGSPFLDFLSGTSRNDEIYGFEGDDSLFAGWGQDLLVGGAGDDYLSGFSGSDTYLFSPGDGNDTINDGGENPLEIDTLRLTGGITPEDLQVARDSEHLYIFIEASDETLTLDEWFEDPNSRIERIEFDDGTVWTAFELEAQAIIGGTEEDDVLIGTPGNDRLVGYGGNDVLVGLEGDDLLNGGEDDDELSGSDGSDTYLFSPGDGFDTINDGGESPLDVDTLRLTGGITPGELEVERDSQHLYIYFESSGEVLTFDEWFVDSNSQIERVEFDDGTIWTAAELESRAVFVGEEVEGTEGDDVLVGTPGGDYLVGYGGNDVLQGLQGDDWLEGGDGDDTYLFGLGDGADEIFDEDGNDSLQFGAGIDPALVLVTRDPYALVLLPGLQGDRVSIYDWFSDDAYKVELVQFDDQTMWNTMEVESRIVQAPATEFDDLLTSISGDSWIDGLGGDDYLYGLDGNDVLEGGAGEDLIDGGEGNNVLLGGDGDDYLYSEDAGAEFVAGGLGDDDVISLNADGGIIGFNAGDGVDFAYFNSSQSFTLSVGGASASDIYLSTDGFDLYFEIGAEDSLALGAFAFWSPSIRPTGNLQIVGADVNTYDLSAVLQEFLDAYALDPQLGSWSAAQSLTANLLSTSATHAIGGAIAYEYATTGGVSGLSASQIHTVLGEAGFGFDPQPISLGSANAAPELDNPIADQSANEDTTFSFAVPGGAFSDPDVGDTLTYAATLADGSALPAWLTFDAETQTFSGTPLQADVGAIDVEVTATDGGGLSAQDTFTLTVENVNDAPVVTPAAATQTMLLGQSVDAASLFAVADEDGDAPAQYEFWDSTAGNGYFAVNGVEQAIDTAIVVEAADLANTTFVGGSEAGSDQVWVRATDGQTYGAWKSWTMNSWPHVTNAAPVADAPDNAVLRDQSVLAQSLFTVTDADGDAPVQYEFWDGTAGGGYFAVEGEAQTNNPIPVAAADLDTVTYVGGADAGVEQVWVRASDGMQWGDWESWNMTTALHIPNAAPEATPTAATQTVLLAQSVAASSLFSVLDADADPAVRYEFFDSTAGNGYFAVNGVEQAINTAIVVDAADLANAEFVGSMSSGADQVWVRATDGQSFGAWVSWTMNSWLHITNAAPVADAEAATILTGEAVAAASLFSVSDADGDAAVRYEFWDDVAGGGYWRVNGIQQAAAAAIAVEAADLANAEYVGAANPGSEQVWVRANDGMAWGAWESWTMNSWPHLTNDAPVVTASNTTVLLGQSVDASSLFAVTDADVDVITQYEFWDSTAGNGHFTVGGIEQGVNVAIGVTAAQLADTDFVAAASTGSDLIWVRAHDGMAWSDWKSWSMNSWPHLTNAAPVVSASNAGILRNEALSAAMFFGVADADGDTAVQYEFWDDLNGGGHWALDGVQQAASQAIPVTAAQLADLDFVGAANSDTEQVWVRASDGMGWSAWKNWLMATEGGMLRGGDGPDTLNGEAGPTVLQGGGGNDTLTDTDGDNLFSGGDGDDQMTGGDGNDLLAGGSGNDTINTGGGNNIIAYNAGGGIDTVVAPTGSVNTLSFGGGIGYDDLSLSKNGNDLIVSAGENDQVVLKDWYSGSNSVLNLQIVHDASDEFDAGSADPLYNKKVQTFDFAGMVAEFDDALAQSPGLTSWAVTNALLQFHLSGSDDAAIGGDLAYWYGKNNGFTGISLQAAQQVIGGAGFGSDAQSLQSFNGLQEGYVKLA